MEDKLLFSFTDIRWRLDYSNISYMTNEHYLKSPGGGALEWMRWGIKGEIVQSFSPKFELYPLDRSS